MPGYQEQLDRVRRFFERFKRINDGYTSVRSDEDLLDDIYGFFQNCYHLKDWLKNDRSFNKHSGQDIEDYITNTVELAICADICNSTKHLALTSNPRSGALPKMGAKHFTFDVKDGGSCSGEPFAAAPTSISMKVAIDHNGVTLDAFEVAKKALEAWESFV